MDFYKVREKKSKGEIEIYPDFSVVRSSDLMVRGKSFYAIWDEERGLWSTDEYDVQRLIDQDLMDQRESVASMVDGPVTIRYMRDFSSGSWRQFRNYLSNLSDSSTQLDEKLTFANTVVTKRDYVSRRLPYSLEAGPHDAWDEIVGTLYDPENRAKIEWAIGSVISGDSKDIQKFMVLYGAAGTGKSTILNIIQKLFVGYYTSFEAKALTSSSNAFSTEVFKSNPLVAIQHDGDLSKIEDNTKLNSIISHEDMTMNEKYKPSYMSRINAFLFMGTNKPVKITDAKSGIIRRLIDVRPSGNRIPPSKYYALLGQIDFELGAIAKHCLEVYRDMGREYYSAYRPVEMMLQTDVFYNFIEAYYPVFRDQDGASLKQAYELYKTYCDDTLVEFKLPQYKFREELKNYFTKFQEIARIDGKQVRSYYSHFQKGKFLTGESVEEHPLALVLEDEHSILDKLLADRPAQYAVVNRAGNEIPKDKWSVCSTTLKDLDTTQLHYVKPPASHIVIDFDLKDDMGNKDPEMNMRAASAFPPTYAEYSKGGGGIHLHYFYDGDVEALSRIYDFNIEIKVFTGDASLRRKLSKCNNLPIHTLRGGLPIKEKKVLNFDAVQSEAGIRSLVERNLRKEVHPGTKPSIDFIHKILDDAYKSGLSYDVTDLRQKVLAFAMNSSNQSAYCLKLVAQMRFKSDEPSEADNGDGPLVYFDVEVFPNLFLISWKYAGVEQSCTRMINPTPAAIEELMRNRLVGFFCRRYDNHILYAAYLGYNNQELYELSQRLVTTNSGTFAEAYGISYADVWDYASKKQSLKVWQIELGIKHQELGLPWEQPVPDDMVELVGEYCDNDVISTEAVADARSADFTARKILAELSGLTVNDTTQRHTARILFGKNKQPQDAFVYTDLSEMFEGYKYDYGTSTYKGEVVGEGGLVRAKPGMYHDVAVLDAASMHPTSIILLNLFGTEYTKRFAELKEARIAIKHKEFDRVKQMLDGKLAKFVTEDAAEALSYALKIVINIVYGLTSAKFENPFRDVRNKDNIVAKRGALFMMDLREAVEERGFEIVHIKTDSVKIPGATPEIIKFVQDFGARYGYDFEHECTYSKLCLVNDAVYIAKTASNGVEPGKWVATGAQFAEPYVYKTLFSKEPLVFDDFCQTKTVTTALYLDMNEDLAEGEHDYVFVGRAGEFTPVVDGVGGGLLMRQSVNAQGETVYHAAGGSKGYRWLESVAVRYKGLEDKVDHSYYKKLVDQAATDIAKYGDIESFLD